MAAQFLKINFARCFR